MRKIYLLFFILLGFKSFSQTYPAAFDLSSGNYTFTGWPATSPSGSYPANMIFHFVNDPSGGSFNTAANGNSNYNCNYNLTSRNRINGLEANGFSFVATSSALWDNCASGSAASTRFVGTALLALNSTGVTNINVSWTGKTIAAGDGAPVPRAFSIKLQYRLGTSGNWTDVPGAGIYNSAAAGNSAVETAVLPAACENRSDLFIRWIYYQTASNNGGSRPEMGIDDITVGTPAPANNLSLTYSSSTIPALLPPFISGTINDASDPAAVTGFAVDVKDNGIAIPSTDYTLTLSSSNTTVVPAANVNITKNNGTALIKITPAAVGYSDITFTLTKGSFTKTLVTSYAASQSSSSNAKWLTGIADASAAIALDDNYMVIANDETNLLYVYDRNNSGLPVKTYDFNQGNVLGLTDGAPNYKEVDIEAGVKSVATPGRIYWLGSMSNSSSFNDKPNRNRLFAVNVSGTGNSTGFTDAGYYSNLRSALIAWGDANGYNFSASAAAGQDPKLINGFNIEGMTFGPDNTTLYIGFRAPLVPLPGRTKAVIAPIQNFETWFNNGTPVGSPTIGNPIELDLGGRGIRDIIRLSTGPYIILAGNYDNTPIDGRVYRWSGTPGDAPVLLSSFNVNSLNAEAVMEIFEGGVPSLSKLQVIEDNGSFVFYNDGTEAKDLAQNTYKKFSSETFVSSILGVLPVQFEYVHAGMQGAETVISWGMQQPAQVQSYEILYSADGLSFTGIGNAAGSSSAINYSYRIVPGKTTTGYYRVRALLNTGNSIYSEIRFINAAKDQYVQVYPNPAAGDHVTLTASFTGKAAVFNAEGKLVIRIDVKPGQNNIDTKTLGRGNYFIKLIGEDQHTESVSFMKL